MAYQALATPEAGANLTRTVPASANGTAIQSPVLATGISYERPVISLIPARRNAATEAFAPLWLAPPDAPIVAVGRHFSGMAAVAWISDHSEIVVTIDADRAEIGRAVLIRVWSRQTGFPSRGAILEAHGVRAMATAVIGAWDGLPVAGLALVSVLSEGEEQ